MSYPAFEKKLQERLSKATVGEVCTRPCEYLAETDHLETALTKLRTLKLYSLPLVNANMEQVGFIDMLDIVTFVMAHVAVLVGDNGIESLQQTKKLKETICKEAVSGREPYVPIVEATSSLVALRALNELGSLHRMPVINASGDLVGLLSQVDLVRVIASFVDELDLAKSTVGQYQLGIMDVQCVKKTAQVKAAFKVMKSKTLNGLAVVEESGALVGNVSASDLKYIGDEGEMFKVVEYPIYKFLEKIGQLQVLTVTEATTFAELAKLFDLKKIHRVYVVDSDKRPIGVITLTNYLHFLLQAAIEQ